MELGILESNLIDYAAKMEWIPAAIRDGRPLRISRQVRAQKKNRPWSWLASLLFPLAPALLLLTFARAD